MTKETMPAVANGNGNFDLAILDNDSMEVVRENMASEEFSASDLDRVSVPAGGSTMWEVNTPEGIQNVAEFKGVIVLATKGRSYWSAAFGSGEATPPDCASYDCVTGIGEPGGDCATCPFNQFGSANGNGKACREKRTLFILQDGELLPTILNVPPSSIKALKSYMLRLTKSGTPLSGCVTAFSLSRAVSKSNIKYSAVNFNMAEKLDPQRRAAVQDYIKSFGSTMERAGRAETHEGGDGDYFDSAI